MRRKDVNRCCLLGAAIEQITRTLTLFNVVVISLFWVKTSADISTVVSSRISLPGWMKPFALYHSLCRQFHRYHFYFELKKSVFLESFFSNITIYFIPILLCADKCKIRQRMF